jgi:signal transduction histidine kinase/ligand-binding sensor domain-containing protein/DNA-binding NarL/FixJ family response regulator
MSIGNRFLLLLLLFFLRLMPLNGQENELKFEHITSEDGLAQNTIHGIVKDKYGFLWFGTWGGLCRYDGYKFKVYRYNTNNPKSINNNRIHNIIKDKNQDLWVLTFKEYELCRYNYETDDFERIPYYKVPVSFYKLLSRRDHYRTVNFAHKDLKWSIATNSHELIEKNKQTENVRRYRSNIANRWSLNDSYVTEIYKDDQNIFWVGTYSNGINKANLNAKAFKYFYHDPTNSQSIADNGVRAICEDNRGNLWIGTRDRGISIIQKDGSFKHITHVNGKVNTISSNEIKQIYCDAGGRVWIGTKKGLDCYDPATGSFRTIRELYNIPVYGFAEDKQKRLWMATWNGVAAYLPQSDRLIRYDAKRTLKNRHGRIVLIDSSGNLWIGTEGGGISLLKVDSGKDSLSVVKHFEHKDGESKTISDNRIYSMIEDKQGDIWLGTGNGLDRIEKKSHAIKHIAFTNGSTDAAVAGIIEDKKGNLWVSHKNGISKLARDLSIRQFTMSDGLQSNEFSDGAFYKSKFADQLFFGGNNGFNSFTPDSIKPDLTIPKTVITQIQILNRDVALGEEVNGRAVLNKPLHLLKELALNYADKNISIEFAGLHFANPKGNKYAYKLEGVDPDWIYADAERRWAKYSNLESGDYRFMVKSSNSDGVWNNEPTILAIRVNPPFWASTNAYVFYFLLVAGCLYLYHYYTSKYARLNKEKELHQHKIQFFTNISHEIKTPLSLILAPIDRLADLCQDNKIATEQINVMRNSGNRLLRLINQLLDFRRLESGNVSLNLQRNNLIPFIDNILSSFSPALLQKNLSLSFVKGGINALYFSYDEDKVEKILSNLLSNALKFTCNKGYIKVLVKEELLSSGRFVAIDVLNSGKGIPEEDIKKIFEPFSKASGNQQDGTGLGLTYSKGLVELHGGKIDVSSSEIANGVFETKFSVLLPAGNMESEDSEEQAYKHNEEEAARIVTAAAEVETEDQPQLEKTAKNAPRLLIIEDNESLRSYLKDYFSEEYSVSEAEDGEEGFETAAEQIPDLIISDIMMPKMDGLDFCKKLKSHAKTAHIPVVLLTSRAPMESQIEGYESGADDYILKPFNLNLLAVRIKNILASRRSLKDRYRKEISIQPSASLPDSPDEKLMQKILGFVESRLADPNLTIDIICKEVCMSRTHLYRKIKTLTGGLSMADVIKEIRLKRAQQLLKDRKFNVNEVSYMVGFVDVDHFRKCFKSEFGLTPSEFSKKSQMD